MKILLTATMQSHICQFHLPLIRLLKAQGHTVEVAANNNLYVKPGLHLEDEVDRVYDVPFARSPFSASNVRAYKQLKKILAENEYDVIHCNTPMGGVITRLAAAGKRKKGTRVIYTAHGFHFYKGAPLKSRLMYLPVEFLLSYVTDTLICINTEDYAFAKKYFHAKQIEYVHGVGFDAGRCVRNHSKEEAREILGIPKDANVLLSVGELNRRKNHKVILAALAEKKDPNVFWYVAGNGPLEETLRQSISESGLEKNVFLLGYTRELTTYFEAADLFVFPSLQEGLPVALMEIMKFGLPTVASDIRGNRDLIEDGVGGFLADKNDSAAFSEKIGYMLAHPDECEKMVEHNKQTILSFETPEVLREMAKIYGI